MEAEYIALSQAMRDLIPVRRMLQSVCDAVLPDQSQNARMYSSVFENNNGALQLARAPRGDGKDWRAIECAELLLQHGAKMEVGEGEATRHILDVAEEQGAEKEMFDHLWKKTPETEKRDRLGLLLYEAAKNSDMNGLAEALAQGASVGWKNPKDGGKSALHIGVLGKKPADESKWTAIESVELLLGRGGDLELLDNDGHSVVDCAVVGGAELEMIEYLNDRPN